MAATRCPQCQIPMTEDEARAAACPVCAAPFVTPAPSSPVAAPVPTRSRTGPRLAVAAALLAVAAASVYVYSQWGSGHEPPSERAAISPSPERRESPKKQSPAPSRAEKLPPPTRIVQEDLHAPERVAERIPAPPVVVQEEPAPKRVEVVKAPPAKKKPDPKVVTKPKEKPREKPKEKPVPGALEGEVFTVKERKLNRPNADYTLPPHLAAGKKIDLSGKARTLRLAQVANHALLEITGLDAQTLDIGRIENHSPVKVSGKVKKLTVGPILNGGSLDASKLEAEEVVFTGQMEGHTRVKLNGKLKRLRVEQHLANGAALDALQLDAQTVTFARRLDGHVKVNLSGKVKTLTVNQMSTGAQLDASKLLAQEVVFTDRIDGHSRVKLQAPGGTVEFRSRVEGNAQLEIKAPGGKVTFTEPSAKNKPGSRIDGGARVTITAKEAEFRGILNGNGTQVLVTLTDGGVLRFRELDGQVRLQYRKADRSGPEPVVEAGAVRGRAKVEKLK